MAKQLTAEEEAAKVAKETGSDLTDVEIAELANKELRKKDEELAKLRKELAQAKLYSLAEDEEEESLSREECIKRISSNRTTNYDYAEAVIGLVDCETAEGKPNPLGSNGEEVYNFFKEVIKECDGDKSRFTSVYQARIGSDDKSTAMAYNNRN